MLGEREWRPPPANLGARIGGRNSTSIEAPPESWARDAEHDKLLQARVPVAVPKGCAPRRGAARGSQRAFS